MLIDSHCHLNRLDLTAYNGNLAAVLSQSEILGVRAFLSVAVTLGEHEALRQIAQDFPQVFISVGQHPDEAPGEPITSETILAQAQHPKVIAIGETGLDYYRLTGDLTWQRDRFITHIECAKQCAKPLIIHTRSAQKDTIDIMQSTQAREIGGVMHCFTEDWDMAKQALDLNFYISFSGIVTFKNAHILQEVARKVPLDRFLIETDSPYLAPVPFRGKPNIPGYVCYVAEYIAGLRGVPISEIAKASTENFIRLFKLNPDRLNLDKLNSGATS